MQIVKIIREVSYHAKDQLMKLLFEPEERGKIMKQKV